MNKAITRRRFISITAAAGLVSAMPLPLLANINDNRLYHWKGFAMGADASIKLYGNNKPESENLTKKCLKEIIRLEKIFSLYEPNSVINQLNKSGKVDNPPVEFVELLSKARTYSDLTDGDFDITVQPLWENRNKELINYKNIQIENNFVNFKNPEMAITLNGIAQGYITDKVTELLKDNGVDNVLVNMGEMRALGNHGDGQPWQINIKDSEELVKLENMAIATSGNNGAVDNHIFNPKSGKTTKQYKSVSVIAPTATDADALSTAFYIMPFKKAVELIRERNTISAIFIKENSEAIRVS